MYLLFAPIFVTYLVIINFKEEQNNGILPSYVLNFKYRRNVVLFKLTFLYCFSALFFTILLVLPSLILTIIMLKSELISYDYFIYLKFYLVILLFLILLVPMIFLFLLYYIKTFCVNIYYFS